MNAKKGLAAKIVADFHSEKAAQQAADDWAKQFQKGEVPESVETVVVKFADVAAHSSDGSAIKLDKLLARCGLAESVSDGLRKIRQKAVRIDGKLHADAILPVNLPAELTIRAGKLLRKVRIS
jgi:tyrosyl-tRNA synthetase